MPQLNMSMVERDDRWCLLEALACFDDTTTNAAGSVHTTQIALPDAPVLHGHGGVRRPAPTVEGAVLLRRHLNERQHLACNAEPTAHLDMALNVVMMELHDQHPVNMLAYSDDTVTGDSIVCQGREV